MAKVMPPSIMLGELSRTTRRVTVGGDKDFGKRAWVVATSARVAFSSTWRNQDGSAAGRLMAMLLGIEATLRYASCSSDYCPSARGCDRRERTSRSIRPRAGVRAPALRDIAAGPSPRKGRYRRRPVLHRSAGCARRSLYNRIAGTAMPSIRQQPHHLWDTRTRARTPAGFNERPRALLVIQASTTHSGDSTTCP